MQPEYEDTIMKTISTLAIGLSLALASAGVMASAANAATTMKKPGATACVASKSKPCPQKHAGLTTHKKKMSGKVEPKKS
jgi:hypothetical protein